MTDALVIGAGPAGLMAAEVLAKAGFSVTVADAMPSVGRKFLMAGKSGLNLTKAEPTADFLAAYGPLPDVMQKALRAFGPTDVIAWAEELEQSVFIGSTDRVFPNAMKASPLLRAWLARLTQLDVVFETHWRWQGWEGGKVVGITSDKRRTFAPKVTILALGGSSWSRLGADGQWVTYLPHEVAPFAPANMGFKIDWSDHMQRFFGAHVKAVALHAGNTMSRGEFVVSERGIEGGGVYMVSRAVREGAKLMLDLLPDWSLDQLRVSLARPRGKTSLSNHLRKCLRLDPIRIALLSEFGRPFPNDLAPLIKALPIHHAGPRPLDEAISTAGGIRFDALDDGLMLRNRPSVFCAGEMLDWEAPTGGYLINGCLATGRWTGQAAVAYLRM